MHRSSLHWLRCPACSAELNLETRSRKDDVATGTLRCPCGERFSISDGVLNIVYPAQLHADSEEFRTKYDQGASQYDIGLKWLFESFYENEERVRTQLCDLLELEPGHRVLEIGCGTGKDSVHIIPRIGTGGELYLLELSSGMLHLARKRLAKQKLKLEYVLANASYLPFADGTFDAVFHFGGLNVFGDIRRALAEMARVVKVGGRVVAGDEGVAPWIRQKLYGKILRAANPLYRHTPPIHLLPENVRDVSLHWLLGNAFYVIAFRTTKEPPQLNLDLPIPGKRGGTLRSRYYGT